MKKIQRTYKSIFFLFNNTALPHYPVVKKNTVTEKIVRNLSPLKSLSFLFPLFLPILISCSNEKSSQKDFKDTTPQIETQSFKLKTSVCDRTEEIKKAILEETNQTNCQNVSSEHLSQVIGLKIITDTLVNLKSHDFHGLTHLTELAIAFNRNLKTLPPRVFSELTNLEQLVLNNNQLKILPPETFSGLTNLKRLSLDNNQLESLPPLIFSNLKSLKIIVLTNNPFSDEEKTRITEELKNKKTLTLEI